MSTWKISDSTLRVPVYHMTRTYDALLTEEENRQKLIEYFSGRGFAYVRESIVTAWPEIWYFFLKYNESPQAEQVVPRLAQATQGELDAYMPMFQKFMRLRRFEKLCDICNTESEFHKYLKSLSPDELVGLANGLPILTGNATMNAVMHISNLPYADPISVFLHKMTGFKVVSFHLRFIELENGDTEHNPAMLLIFNEKLGEKFDGPVTAEQCLIVFEEWVANYDQKKKQHQ